MEESLKGLIIRQRLTIRGLHGSLKLRSSEREFNSGFNIGIVVIVNMEVGETGLRVTIVAVGHDLMIVEDIPAIKYQRDRPRLALIQERCNGGPFGLGLLLKRLPSATDLGGHEIQQNVP